MKSLAEKIAVMQAAEAGKPIDKRSRRDSRLPWLRVNFEIDEDTDFNFEVWDYRVALTKPSIDWNAVAEPFDALATDESDGITWVVQRKDDFGFRSRRWEGVEQFVNASIFSSFVPGTCAPEDSLVLRPKKWKSWNKSPVQPTCDYVDVLREYESLPVMHVIPNTVNWRFVTQWRLSGED